MNIRLIYLILILVITLWAVFEFIRQSYNHFQELEKISRMEEELRKKEEELEKLRKDTNPCPFKNLITPRKCYEESNYKCTWNEVTSRCEEK